MKKKEKQFFTVSFLKLFKIEYSNIEISISKGNLILIAIYKTKNLKDLKLDVFNLKK